MRRTCQPHASYPASGRGKCRSGSGRLQSTCFRPAKLLVEIKLSLNLTFRQLSFNWIENGSDINSNITLAQFNMDVVLHDTYATDYYDLAYPGIIMKIYLSR